MHEISIHFVLNVFLTVLKNVCKHLKNVLRVYNVMQVVECEWERRVFFFGKSGH